MIRAIVFDYGNVIARFDNSIFLKRIAPFSSLSPEEILGVVQSHRQLINDYESGRITSADFFLRIVERLKLDVTEQEFHDAFVRIFERIPSTIELIKHLKPKFKLGLLSNTNEWHFLAEIKPLEVFHLFDSVTLSFEVGAMKPARAIYDDALTKLRVQPEECVYIDDIPEYVQAARALGITAIQYTSHDQLLRALESAGIRPQPPTCSSHESFVSLS